jgi:DNA-binding transcriptional regulator YhcF (GntR family)
MGDVRLSVDPTSPVPPFEQVRRQVAEQAESGVLPAGHRLPTVRRLAEDLGLAVNTVARAYRELEQDGVVETRGRNGTFVAVRGADAEREGAVAARQYARRVRELGLDADRAVRLVREALS